MSLDNKKLIDDFISKNPDSKSPQTRIESLNGEQKIIQGYRLPTKLVFYNVNNGRFKKEYINLVRKYGGELDSQKPEDAKKIQNMLLSLGTPGGDMSVDSKRTMNDIAKKGQLELGIITQDGFLIDGNRRLAVIDKLFEEKQESKYEYINVARLEQPIQNKDMWAMEAGISLGMDPKVRYGPLNELLKLDEGLKVGFSETEIANLLYGDIPPDEIINKIKRLKLIKSYLKHFFKDEENLELAEGKNQHFIELQSILETAKDKTISEQVKIKSAGFNLIYTGISSDRIRIMGTAIKNDYDLLTLFQIADSKVVQPDPNEDEELKDKKSETEIKFLNLEDEVRAQKNKESVSLILTHILNNFKVLDFDKIDLNDGDSKNTILKILEKMKKLETKVSE